MPRRDESSTPVLDRPVEGQAQTQDGESVNGTENVGTEAGTPGAGTPAQAVAARKAKRNPDELGPEEIISINVRMPNALRMQVAGTAVEQSTSVPQLITSMIADAYGFTLPETAKPKTRKKYASKEERMQAQKAAQQAQRVKTRAILDAIEEGKLNVDMDALLAAYNEKQAREAAEKQAREDAATATATAAAS